VVHRQFSGTVDLCQVLVGRSGVVEAPVGDEPAGQRTGGLRLREGCKIGLVEAHVACCRDPGFAVGALYGVEVGMPLGVAGAAIEIGQHDVVEGVLVEVTRGPAAAVPADRPAEWIGSVSPDTEFEERRRIHPHGV
jgi:hypothetical protein